MTNRQREFVFGSILVVAFIVFVVVTVTRRAPPSSANTASSSLTNAAPSLALGDRVDGLTFQDIRGQTVRTSEVGRGLILFMFWNSACADCLTQLQTLDELAQDESITATMLAVRQGEGATTTPALKKVRMLIDPHDTAGRALGVTKLPTIIYVSGRAVVGVAIGPQSGDQIRATIAKLLKS